MVRNTMAKTLPLVFLAGLGACTSTAAGPDWVASKPVLTGSFPAAAPAPAADGGGAAFEDAGAPNHTTLPVGIGMTFGPSAPMLAAALDFPLDKQITFGPSVQYAFEDDLTLMTATAQIKYYLGTDDKKAKFLPYATFGAGLASIDKDGRSSDSGFLINAGAGVRLLTGDHYRVGSELRFNWLPDDVGGEDNYFSLELVQVVISF